MVRWSKEHHSQAKREGTHLICLSIYGKHVKKGSITYEGVGYPADVLEIDELILKLVKRHNSKAKKPKGDSRCRRPKPPRSSS